MKIITRMARADDKQAMWRLYESEMKPHIETIWGWNTTWQSADFDQAFTGSSTRVVEVDGEFSGYVQLDLGAAEIYLRMIILVPGRRSLGIGVKLLAQMLQISRQDGRPLSLRVFRTNLAAKRFYERQGWHVAADQGDFFLMKPTAVSWSTSEQKKV